MLIPSHMLLISLAISMLPFIQTNSGKSKFLVSLAYKIGSGWAAKAELRPKKIHDAQNSPLTSSKRIRGVQNRPVLRSLSLMNCVKERDDL